MDSKFNLAYSFNKDMSKVASPCSAGFIDVDEVECLYPIDPFTGRRSDAIQQLLQADSVAEKNAILQRDDLQKITDSSRISGLSDADLLALLKPRYVDSLTERSSFAQYVQEIVENGIVETSPESEAHEDGAPVDAGAPVDGTSDS